MDIIQEAEEYIQNHTLPESTNAGLNLIERLISRVNELESRVNDLEGTIRYIRNATDTFVYDKY